MRLPWICLEKVHLFEKRRFFHEIFQVGACPNLKDSSFFEWFSILVYKARSSRYLQLICSICDSLMLYKVHYFGKRWFFMKYFKLVHVPTWKIPHYMKGILFICVRQEAFSIFNNFPLSATLLCLVRYIFSSPELAQDELLGNRDVRRPSYVWMLIIIMSSSKLGHVGSVVRVDVRDVRDVRPSTF